MENKEELLKKIKALAEGGVGGEKENAQKLLQELMEKYNIQEEDIEEDVIKEFDITVPRFYNAGYLANQVLYSVVGKDIEDGKKGFYSYRWNGRKKHFIKCTSAEFLEFEAKFKFYMHHFKIEIERFYSAFIQANKIFPPPDKCREEKQRFFLTDEELKMLDLAEKLEKHEYRLQIEGGK